MTNMNRRKAARIISGSAPILIVVGVLVKTVSGSESFITLYSRCAAVIVASIVAAACIRMFRLYTDDHISLPLRIGFCISSFFAIGQNLVFMAYGLYRSLTTYSAAGMTMTAIGGFLIVYAVNTVITVYGIRLFIDKPWGMIAPLVIACAGANLISMW